MFRNNLWPVLCTVVGCLWATAPYADTKIRFNLNWFPQAEHCGFFQAQATGLYEAVGLNVEIRSGGPDLNVPMLVAGEVADLAMGSSFTTLNMASAGIEAKTIAAFFQKSPQTLVAHPGQGIETLQDLKDKPIMIAQFARFEFWQFLKAKFGFTDDQLRNYTYSSAPFLADVNAVQQGYVTEDAFFLGKELGESPVVLLLADYGYSNYATTVFGLQSYLEDNRYAVASFLEATIEGYSQCVSGQYDAAMAAVLAANPEHSEELFHFKMEQIIERGLVSGGDAEKLGIGAMTHERWSEFFSTMSGAGLYDANLDYEKYYSLDYIPK